MRGWWVETVKLGKGITFPGPVCMYGRFPTLGASSLESRHQSLLVTPGSVQFWDEGIAAGVEGESPGVTCDM